MKNLKNIMCIILSCLCLHAYCQQIKPLLPILETESGDMYSHDSSYGVVLTSPDGRCFRIRVENSGAVVSEPVNCSTTGNPSITMTPAPNTTLTGSSQTFTITPNNPTWTYGIWIGSVNDINAANSIYFDSGSLTSNNIITAAGLPTNGEALYLRTAINKGNGVEHELFAYTAHSSSSGFDHNCANASYDWVKLTNNTSTSVTNPNYRVPQYSQIQAFNADESLIALLEYNGGIFDFNGNELYPNIPFGILENGNAGTYFWDNNDPYKMYGCIRNQNKLISLDVRNPTVHTVIYDAGSPVSIGGAQGSPDDAQTKVILQLGNSEIRIVDLLSGQVLHTTFGSNIDWAGMSHSGKYYVIHTNTEVSFYRTSDNGLQSSTTNRNHGDFVTALDGTEYFSIVGNSPRLFNIETGVTTMKGTGTGWGHMSGRGPKAKVYSSFDGGTTYGIGPFELDVNDNWENAIQIGNPPTHIQQSGSYSITQMKYSSSKSGQYGVAVITNPHNVPNTYLITKSCP